MRANHASVVSRPSPSGYAPVALYSQSFQPSYMQQLYHNYPYMQQPKNMLIPPVSTFALPFAPARLTFRASST